MDEEEDAVAVVLVRAAHARSLRQLAVPVLRQHGLDDALPELPEQLITASFQLLRPSCCRGGDAAGGFAAGQAHDGLVLLRHRPASNNSSSSSSQGCCSSSSSTWLAAAARFRRLGCRASAAELGEARRQQQQRQWHQQQQPLLILPLALPQHPPLLQQLAAAVVAYNDALPAELPPLAPLLLSTAERSAAATRIQACWRAHWARRQHCVAERTLQARAARLIQRAWHTCECAGERGSQRCVESAAGTDLPAAPCRAVVLRHRLAMLRAVSDAWAAQQVRLTNVLCVDALGQALVEAAAERGRASCGDGMFPEHR